MAPGLRNVLAVIVGLVAGSAVNMGLIMLGSTLIPAPPGVDVTNAESLKSSMHLFEARHFVTPFVAHAGGTLVGALVAFLLATGNRAVPAWIIGGLFLVGGIYASRMFPAPVGFIAADLVFAYIPMAWIGIRFGQALTGNEPSVA